MQKEGVVNNLHTIREKQFDLEQISAFLSEGVGWKTGLSPRKSLDGSSVSLQVSASRGFGHRNFSEPLKCGLGS